MFLPDAGRMEIIVSNQGQSYKIDPGGEMFFRQAVNSYRSNAPGLAKLTRIFPAGCKSILIFCEIEQI